MGRALSQTQSLCESVHACAWLEILISPFAPHLFNERAGNVRRTRLLNDRLVSVPTAAGCRWHRRENEHQPYCVTLDRNILLGYVVSGGRRGEVVRSPSRLHRRRRNPYLAKL